MHKFTASNSVTLCVIKMGKAEISLLRLSQAVEEDDWEIIDYEFQEFMKNSKESMKHCPEEIRGNILTIRNNVRTKYIKLQRMEN